MSEQQKQIIQNISLLYELSLAVGTSLDFKENSEHFLRLLMKHKNLSFAAIWLREDFVGTDISNKYLLSYAIPQTDVLEEEIDPEANVLKYLGERSFYSLNDKHPDFLKIIQEKKIYTGAYAIFRLEDFGFLKIFNPSLNTPFSDTELHELKDVIDRFANSLRVGINHQQLLETAKPKLDINSNLTVGKDSVGHSLTDGLIISNLEDKIVYANDKIAEMSGYHKDELVGKVAHKMLLAEHEWEGIIPKLEDRKKGISEQYEATFVKKNKELWWAIINVSPYKNARGQITGAIAGISDITEKKLAKLKLEESNRKYRDLFENMNDAFIVLSNDGYIKEANKAAKELFGFHNSERISWHFSKFVHPDDRERSNQYYEALRTKGVNSNYEGRIITKQSDIRYIQVNSSAIIKNGKFEGSRDFIRDITVKKEWEQRIQTSENKMRRIIDTALDGVLIVNEKMELTEWNPQCEVIFGYKKEDIINKKLPNVITHQDLKSLQIQFLQFLRTLDTSMFVQRIELEGYRKDGEKFPIELSVTPIKNGNNYYFSAFVRDISERRLAEEKREKLLSELEYINQELKEFAYIVSHDLKAPLRAIRSLAGWIEDDYKDVIDEDGRESLRLLQGRVDRMQSFINGILEYSRIGRIKGSKEMMDLNKSLEELVVFLDPPKNFTVNLIGPFPTIYAEKIRIEQVFQNLMSNAFKYNDKEHGIVDIKCKEDDDFYIFSVEDNGKGIGEKDFKKIFQIFQTLQARDKYESTGIGLTIVKKIVETHGGVISVDSVVGEGTTFSFTFPKTLTKQEEI